MKKKKKIIKVDEETHLKLKTNASSLGLSMKDYIKKLAKEFKPYSQQPLK